MPRLREGCRPSHPSLVSGNGGPELPGPQRKSSAAALQHMGDDAQAIGAAAVGNHAQELSIQGLACLAGDQRLAAGIQERRRKPYPALGNFQEKESSSGQAEVEGARLSSVNLLLERGAWCQREDLGRRQCRG